MLSKSLNFTLDELGGAIHALLRDPRQLLMSDLSRTYLSRSRLGTAQQNGFISTTEDTADSIENTVRHNYESLDPAIAARRPYGLLGPLLGVDSVQFQLNELKVLIVGPRTESELFLYMSHGFNQNNVLGLDLITYSDFIVQGDMHKMPFTDESFDIVVFSWVLGYSTNQKQAVSEAIRVLKPNGIVAIGEQWDPTPVQEISKQMEKDKGYKLEGTPMLSCKQLDQLFDGHKAAKLFGTEPPHDQRLRMGWITGIYRVNES